MSQYDFGIIDPYVTVGVELADMLNQWRDAMYSLQRGGTRPPFAVPGMMWINDSAGPTNWQFMWFVSPTVGDVPLFSLNTVTGAVTVSASAGGSFAAATILAQAAASPSVQWNATGNPIDIKNWRMTVNAAGALVLSSYSDAGVLQNSVTFNRDGSIGGPSAAWRTLGRVVPTAGQATVDFQNIAADINDLEFTYDAKPTANAVDFFLRFYNASNALLTASNYNFAVTQANSAMTGGSAPGVIPFAGTSISLTYSTPTRRVNNSATQGGIRGRGFINNIRDATRLKSCSSQSDHLSDDSTAWMFLTGSGTYNAAFALTGIQLSFNSTTFAAGGSITLRGSP